MSEEREGFLRQRATSITAFEASSEAEAEALMADAERAADILFPDHFTLRFTERKVVDTAKGQAINVGITIERLDSTGSGPVDHVGELDCSTESWDRIWRSLVDSTPAFEKRGIQLVRTHGPDRF